MTRMPGPEGRSDCIGVDTGFGGEGRSGCGGVGVAVSSILACWGPGAGVPFFFRARFGGNGGGGTKWVWALKKGCVASWPGLSAGLHLPHAAAQ